MISKPAVESQSQRLNYKPVGPSVGPSHLSIVIKNIILWLMKVLTNINRVKKQKEKMLEMLESVNKYN